MSEDEPSYGRTEEPGENGEGTPSPSPSPAAAGEGVDAGAEVTALREQLAAAQEASAQALADAEGARAEAETHRAATTEAETRALAAHRRALLAENAGQIVAELVNGTTVDELEASVATARDAYARITSELRAQAAMQVPVGASAGVGQTPEELSPIQKITHALSRNGRN